MFIFPEEVIIFSVPDEFKSYVCEISTFIQTI